MSEWCYHAVTFMQEEQALKLKSEKIKFAMKKLKEANVQKVSHSHIDNPLTPSLPPPPLSLSLSLLSLSLPPSLSLPLTLYLSSLSDGVEGLQC